MTAHGYNVMQVCLNGHQITDQAVGAPQRKKPYCPECGAETITACPECRAEIQGYYDVPGVIDLSGSIAVPNNCHNCGAAYPWRQAAIANAIEVMQMDLDNKDGAEAAELVKAIAIETPRTEAAALKLKRLLPKLGKATYDVAIKVIADIAAEQARKVLFAPGG